MSEEERYMPNGWPPPINDVIAASRDVVAKLRGTACEVQEMTLVSRNAISEGYSAIRNVNALIAQPLAEPIPEK